MAESADDFIFFEDRPYPDNRKTRRVSVWNRRSGDELGQIRWYGPWRQYCFFSHQQTIFNPTCLERIVGEMRVMTSAHRATRNV